MPVKSHKVQLEARNNKHDRKFFRRKRSMLESAFEGKRSMLERCFRALSAFKARSSSDFERSVASKEKEACSSIDFERSVASKHAQRLLRRSKKQARAVISSAQWLRSTLEQSFRAPSVYGARLSRDFERIMRKHCTGAVFPHNALEITAQACSVATGRSK